MIGRVDELERLTAEFDAVRRERATRTIRLAGPPGVGTSRLLDEFRAHLVRRRLVHQWWFGSCSRPAGLPLEPFAGVLSDCPGGVAAWFAQARSHADEATTATLLLGGLVTRLRTGATDAPLVMVVDNVDAADPSTHRLLDAVGDLMRDAPVLIVLAGRTTSDGTAPTLLLEPLTDTEMHLLVHPEQPDGSNEIIAAAGGRPGVAIALMTSGRRSATLTRMLAALDASAASAVSAISLAGPALAARTVLDACRIDADVLDELVAHGIVRLGADETASVDEVWMTAARRVAGRRLDHVAALVAEALARVDAHAPAGSAWEVARRPDAAAAAWERAAAEAEAAGAIATAAQWSRRSIELGGADHMSRSGTTAAVWSLAAGDWNEADRLAEGMLAVTSRFDHDDRLVLLTIRYRARREAGHGDADDFLDSALVVADAASEPSVARADAFTLDALRLVLHDRPAARRRCEEALVLATAMGDDRSLAGATAAAALVRALDGDIDGALVVFDDALAIAERGGDVVTESRIASNKVYVLWRAGRPADVVRVATDEMHRLDSRHVGWLGDQLGVAHAVALVLMGRIDEADLAIMSARDRTRAADADALLTLLGAEVDILRGDLRAAAHAIDRVGRSPVLADPTVAAEWALQRSELALAGGDRPTSITIADEALRNLTRDDELAVMRLQLVLCRAGACPSDVIEIEPVGRETAALAAEIAAWRSGETDRWSAAVAAWTSVPSPINAWRCRVQAARTVGDLDELRQLRRALDELAAAGLAGLVDGAIVEAGGRRSVVRIGGPLTRTRTRRARTGCRGAHQPSDRRTPDDQRQDSGRPRRALSDQTRRCHSRRRRARSTAPVADQRLMPTEPPAISRRST